jgi:hypothetical protein
MSALDLSAFTAADLAALTGLPDGVGLDELAPFLTIDRDDVTRGQAGTPAKGRSWVAAESTTYHGGVRLWLEENTGRVVVVEGVSPVDADGRPLLAPELGEPGALFDAVLGPVVVPDAERVYADRGLALHVFPETGAVIRVLVFAPTTVQDYRTRLQPQHEPLRKLPGWATR